MCPPPTALYRQSCRNATFDLPRSDDPSNVNSYTLAGASTLTLAGHGINVSKGSHTISAPLQLSSDATVTVTAGVRF